MALNAAQNAPHQASNRIICRRCSGTPRLLHKILNSRTGGNLRIYKCDCGEQLWLEEPE